MQDKTRHIVTIDSLGARGDGVGCLPDGRQVFVPGVIAGERVAVILAEGTAKEEGRVAARVDEILTPSPQRIAPACRHFGRCGGCVLQHLDSDAYAAFKMEQAVKTLDRAGIKAANIEGPLVSPPGTRRRASFAAYRDHEKFVLGFNEQGSNKIVDLAECPVLTPRLAALIPQLREMVGKILQPGQGMDISVIDSGGAVDMVLRPWVRKKGSDPLPRAVTERLATFAEAGDIARLHWQLSADDESDLMPVALRHPFKVDFSGVRVSPPPGAFLQATAQGERALIERVLGAIPKKAKKIADLYAGSGTFTFALAGPEAAGKYKVHAVEGYAPALDALKAAMPGRAVTAEKRDLAREPLMHKELNAFDAVVLDPPRVGALEQVRMIKRSDVQALAYVSCSAASFARDAAVLGEGGFTLERLSVIDQFLWSPHVELVGVFRR